MSHLPTSEARAARTRTPSELKWLLNERAAVAGALAKTRQRQAQLEQLMEKRRRQLEKNERTLERLRAQNRRCESTLAALDTTMGLVDDRANAAAAGTVNAWQGRYGRRGGFTEFLRQSLQAAAPNSLTTKQLAGLTLQQFELEFLTYEESREFGRNLRRRLRELCERGQVARLHNAQTCREGVWQWVSDRTPTMDALRALEQKVRHERELDSPADPAGNQVAGQ